MSKKITTLMLICLLVPLTLNSNNISTNVNGLIGLNLSVKWSYTISSTDYIQPSPCVYDINNDGEYEILVGANDKFLYCFDAQGGLIWSYYMGDQVKTSPAIADLNRDGKLDILAASYEGKLVCLTGFGKVQWEYNTGAQIQSSPSVADLDNDGNLEVLISSYDYKIHCINATGASVWTYTTDNYVLSSPVLADIDSDGTLEILCGSHDDYFYVLNSDGTLRWRYLTGNNVQSTAALVDFDGDTFAEILISSQDGVLYCLNSTGGLIWNFVTNDTITGSPIIGDLDRNGEYEILIGSWDNYLYCLDSSGGLNWHFKTDGLVSVDPLISDLTGDGNLEVIFGSRDGKMYFLHHNGSYLDEWFCGDIISSSPAIVDIDDDNKKEIIIGAYDGVLYCLDIDGMTESGCGQWLRHRGSNTLTGHIDTDSDYIDDFTEDFYNTNFSLADTDADSFDDWEELYIYGTDPLNSSDTPTQISDDSYEENDDFESSKQLNSNTTYELRAFDDDFFHIVLTDPAIINVDLFADSLEVNLDLFLYNSDESLIKSKTSVGSDETITHSLEIAGTYYIKVQVVDGVFGSSYSLAISEISDDEYEDNEYIEDAATLQVGQVYDLFYADADIFQITLSSGDEIEIRLVFDSSIIDLDIYLLPFDFEGDIDEILVWSEGYSSPEIIEYEADYTGVYYISIIAYLGEDGTDILNPTEYSLSILEDSESSVTKFIPFSNLSIIFSLFSLAILYTIRKVKK